MPAAEGVAAEVRYHQRSEAAPPAPAVLPAATVAEAEAGTVLVFHKLICCLVEGEHITTHALV